MVPEAFYLVWKSGGDAPTKRHELIESAREEARRLAKDNPQIEFFVMRAIEGVIYTENPWRCRNFCKQKEAVNPQCQSDFPPNNTVWGGSGGAH
jgi:hypothetical protein